jgi:hypothetical protein
VAPKYPRNTLEKFEIKPKSFDTTWHRFCLGLGSADRAIFTPSYLLTQAISSLGTHTRQEDLGMVKRRYTESLARYARLGRPTGVWTRAESHFHVFDRVLKRSAAHWLPSARVPRTVGSCPPRLRPAMPEGAYKYLGCTTVCSSLCLTPRARTPTPASSPPPAITARASATTTSSLQPLPSRVSHSVSFASGPWSFPSPRTRQSLTGDPGSPSPDFGRPQPRVDLAIRWAILKFLTHMSSLTSGEAPWPVQLDYRAVSRPDPSPLTSSPTCARGPTYSDHHRRWSAPRRDRQRPPDLTRPLTRATSPPVSPFALFFCRGHCSIRGRIANSISQNPRGFSTKS